MCNTTSKSLAGRLDDALDSYDTQRRALVDALAKQVRVILEEPHGLSKPEQGLPQQGPAGVIWPGTGSQAEPKPPYDDLRKDDRYTPPEDLYTDEAINDQQKWPQLFANLQADYDKWCGPVGTEMIDWGVTIRGDYRHDMAKQKAYLARLRAKEAVAQACRDQL